VDNLVRPEGRQQGGGCSEEVDHMFVIAMGKSRFDGGEVTMDGDRVVCFVDPKDADRRQMVARWKDESEKTGRACDCFTEGRRSLRRKSEIESGRHLTSPNLEEMEGLITPVSRGKGGEGSQREGGLHVMGRAELGRDESWRPGYRWKNAGKRAELTGWSGDLNVK